MSWKTAHRSFYYANAPEPEDIVLKHAETALIFAGRRDHL